MSVAIPALPLIDSLLPAAEADIHRVFELQRDTALRLRSSSVDERLAKLQRLRAAVMAHRVAIIEAGAKDFRRPAIEVEFTELMPVIMEISHTSNHLRKWLKPRRVPFTSMSLGTGSWLRYEPRGRCLIIAPWNYPVNLLLGPLVAALACGNTAMLKTSEMAPHFSAVLCKIVRETFAEDEVAIFEGDASVATTLLSLPFDHMFFTGSPAVGKVVMAAAAKHLASVTLELGGKSPAIIDETADLDLAVRAIIWAKVINNGQTCIAPDHLYVQATVQDRVIELFKTHLRRLYGEGAAARQSGLTRMINQRHTARVAALIEDARQRGANIVHGGTVDVPDHFVEPTLLTDVPREARIMNEEIFGPVLPIVPYGQLDEVVRSINDAPKPLAMYIWSRDERAAKTLLEQTSAGGTCINHVAVHVMQLNLPFGGVNNSGIGSYHGEWGIRAFSHERAVLKTRVFLARMFFPPYSPLMRRIVDFILRHG